MGTEEREGEEGTGAGERDLFRGIWAHMVVWCCGQRERGSQEGDADGDAGAAGHEAD